MYFTDKQLKILNFIRGFILEREVSPTMEEIAQHFHISRVTAHEHVRALEKKKALTKAPNRARSIELADDPRSANPRTSSLGGLPTRQDGITWDGGPALPILGRIAAGSPIEAVEDRQELRLGEWLPEGPEYYVLQVKGESMIEDGIMDGDLVVVERRESARDGEVVVALVEGRDATLKRIYRENGLIRLQPSNSSMDPIFVDDVRIQGVLVGLLRRYRS